MLLAYTHRINIYYFIDIFSLSLPPSHFRHLIERIVKVSTPRYFRGSFVQRLSGSRKLADVSLLIKLREHSNGSIACHAISLATGALRRAYREELDPAAMSRSASRSVSVTRLEERN